MREYTRQPERQSRTLDSNPRASKQAPIADILQAYKDRTLGRPIQRTSAEDEDLLQAKSANQASIHDILQRYKETTQRYASNEKDELLQDNFETAQRAVEDNDELLQGKFDSSSNAEQVPIQREVKPNNTGLPDNLKIGIENLSGYNIDDVKVHYNSDKPAQLQALAYAQGTDIHLAPREEKRLPHEAWHVVQQKQGRVKPTVQMQGIQVNDNEELEHEADVMGEKAVKIKLNIPENTNEKSTQQFSGLRNNTIQRVNSIILNPESSSQEYEIGLLVFSSDPRDESDELTKRKTVKSENPAFNGIIGAGHTMLYGRDTHLAGEMFSYGFWTDNMDVERANLFSEQMSSDLTAKLSEEKGVMGEYRNDTHLALIMDEFETKVVIKVSENLYKRWREFVVSDKEIGRESYTFSPGNPSKARDSSTPEYLNNCVSYALYQTSQFIKCNTTENEEDQKALTSLQNFINSYNDKFEKRAQTKKSGGDEKAGKTGLQGVLMGHIKEYKVSEVGNKIAETDSPYTPKSSYIDSIRKEEFLYFGEKDYKEMKPFLNSFNMGIQMDVEYNKKMIEHYKILYEQGWKNGILKEIKMNETIREIRKDGRSREDQLFDIMMLRQSYRGF